MKTFKVAFTLYIWWMLAVDLGFPFFLFSLSLCGDLPLVSLSLPLVGSLWLVLSTQPSIYPSLSTVVFPI